MRKGERRARCPASKDQLCPLARSRPLAPRGSGSLLRMETTVQSLAGPSGASSGSRALMPSLTLLLQDHHLGLVRKPASLREVQVARLRSEG